MKLQPTIRFAALAILALISDQAFAETIDASEEKDVERYNFDWKKTASTDEQKKFDALMSRGRRALIAAADSLSRRDAAELSLVASDLFARAAKLRPDDPKPHFYAAESVLVWDDFTYRFPKRIKQVIYHLSEFIKLSPYDSRMPEALFDRSIAYTKLGGDDNIRKALADYDLRLQMENQLTLDAYERSNIGLILSNSAELYMYVGELDRAIGLYYDSLEYAVGEHAVLYRYGLAVALDRDGQRTRARAILKDSIRRDPLGPLGQLRRSGVFFIPDGDIQYYRALGFEVLGDKAKAITFYKRFLSVLPKSHYADRARENLAALESSK